jgi:glucosamine 6-phosphate synthetase-like amidotransferase/phosphosugar isomerase protein
MCGIAGFSISKRDHRRINCRQLAKHLLLSIQERGEDATGAAWSESDTEGGKSVMFAKLDIPAHDFVDSLHELMPRYSRTAILHTRWATKGDPADNDNNHPIVVGDTVGVHNGVITNDDHLFAVEQWERIADVDSEAIFHLIDTAKEPVSRLQRLKGRAAIAWLNTDSPDTLHLARLEGSPLYFGVTEGESLVFASTRPLLEEAVACADMRLVTIHEVPEWTYLKVEGGKIVKKTAIPRPNRPFNESFGDMVKRQAVSRASYRGATLFPQK